MTITAVPQHLPGRASVAGEGPHRFLPVVCVQQTCGAASPDVMGLMAAPSLWNADDIADALKTLGYRVVPR